MNNEIESSECGFSWLGLEQIQIWILQSNEYIATIFLITWLIITLFSLAIIVEYFMMRKIQFDLFTAIATLENISKKYNLTEQVTGYLLAIGSSIPEFTTNLIASTSHEENLNIGVGAIAGSGSYDLTLCFGIASFFTIGNGLILNKALFYRDAFVYLFTLALLTFFLKDNIIELYEAFILILLWPLYLYISTLKQIHPQSNEESHRLTLALPTQNTIEQKKEMMEIPAVDPQFPQNIATPAIIEDSSILAISQYNFVSTHDSAVDSVVVVGGTSTIAASNKINIDISNANSNECNEEIRLYPGTEENAKVDPSCCEKITSHLRCFKQTAAHVYSFAIPTWLNWPILCFLYIIVITYIHSQVAICIINSLSSVTKIKKSFLGMTLISWGGNIGDTINAAIATKLGAAELLTTSILGSQITNLQICLGVPWLIAMIRTRYFYSKDSYDVNFGLLHPLQYLLPLFLVVLLSILIFTLCGMTLNRTSGVCLSGLYLIYLFYEFYHRFE